MSVPPQTTNGASFSPAGAEPERLRLQGRALALVLASLMATLLLAALDQTIVSTALPRIISDLHGFDRYTWVVTVYLLAETTLIPIIGKLSDQFGRKWFMVAGVSIFLIGSMLSGTSQTMNALIVFRGIQGIGAGFLFGLIFTLIGDIFTPAERARWQGLFSGTFALASVIGPTLGGWITDNSSWRWIFYINIPLGVVALLLLIFQLPANISVRSTAYSGMAAVRRIDFLGALTAAGGTICLLLGLTWGGTTYAWNAPQEIAVLVGAVALFTAFIFVERGALEPIMPFDLFRNQIFATGALLALTVGMALFAVVTYLPLFIQGVLGQSATNSGTVITPLTLTLAAGGIFGGLIIARVGRYQWLAILGAVVLTGSMFLLTQLNANSTLLDVTRDMIVVGAGMGMLQPVLTLAVQNAIPRSRLGVGTGAITYLRTMGQTLGVAIVGAVVNNSVSSELTKHLPAGASQLPAPVLAAATNQRVLADPAAKQQIVTRTVQGAVAHATAQVPAGPNHAQAVAAVTAQVTTQVTTLLGQVFEATRQSLAAGIHNGFVVGTGISVAVIVITLFLKDVPLATRAQSSAATQAGQATTPGTSEGIGSIGVAPAGH